MKTKNAYLISNRDSGFISGIFFGEDEQEALEGLAKDAGYKSIADADTVAPTKEGELIVKPVREALRDDVIEYVIDRQDVVENGVIHVWAYLTGELRHTIGSQEYRDDEHVLIASFKIWNESKPYDRRAFEFQYDNQ